jgi:uncharacterized protein (TIGR00251 family)
MANRSLAVTSASDLVRADGDDVVVAVHVQPGAGRTAVVGRHGDALKVRVAAPPVDDRANVAAVALLADVLDVAPSSIAVVSGERSRLKRLRAEGIELDDAVERIERALEVAATMPGQPRRRPQ